jgi:pimeloyl-ACP methyl ester carboxylesterase
LLPDKILEVMDMLPAEKYIDLANHVRIPYMETGDAAGIPLVLLHGFADTWHTFELVLPFLPAFIHAFALTQRGSGDVVRPEFGYRTKDFEEDLLMFMDALHIEKAVILGASSGGFTARSFAIRHPGRTLGLVLLGSPSALRNKPSVRETIDHTISKLTDPVDPEFVRDFADSMTAKPVPQAFLDMILADQLKIPARVWREASKGLLEEEFPGELSKIKVPTLMIWGDQDSITTKVDQEELSKAIAGSELKVHPGAGHVLYWEEPDLVASDIVAFMQEIAKAKEGKS